MKVIEVQRFRYPGFIPGDEGWCDVDVYRLADQVLVVLHDQDDQQQAELADHGSTSVTNALETVCHEVSRRLPEPRGLAHLEVHWVHWSRVDGIASNVHFVDRANFALPEWDYLSPEEFGKILAAFEAPDQLERWIAEGALDLDTWDETRGGGRIERDRPN